MKRFFSIVILIVFSFVWSLHNSINSFAKNNNIENNNFCCSSSSDYVEKKCIDKCCVKLIIKYGLYSTPNYQEVINKSEINIITKKYISNIYIEKDKYVIKKINNKYIYYDLNPLYYHSLIKIIKSNT